MTARKALLGSYLALADQLTSKDLHSFNDVGKPVSLYSVFLAKSAILFQEHASPVAWTFTMTSRKNPVYGDVKGDVVLGHTVKREAALEML